MAKKAITRRPQRRPSKVAASAVDLALEAHATKRTRRLDDAAARLIRSHVRAWHRAGEILGFGVGPKLCNGIWTGQTVFQIHLRHKRPSPVLPPAALVPPRLRWPGLDTAVTTDVVERAPFRAAGLDDEERPVFPGLSVGHCVTGETGSLGAIVTAFGGADRYLLGAAHVLAAAGRARIGDDIVQPGAADGGSCPGQTIANLTDFVAFKAGPHYPNTADAALARLQPHIADSPGTRLFDRLAKPGDVGVYDVLYRVGCRTGERAVLVQDVKHATTVEYPQPNGGHARFGFRNLVLYQDFSIKGDSGGPLVTASGALVGIHIAYTPENGLGLAVPVWSLPANWNISP